MAGLSTPSTRSAPAAVVLRALTASTLALASLQPTAAQQQSQTPRIAIAGSSTVYPIASEAIRAFRSSGEGRGVGIDLQETGTSAGLRAFCSGQVVIANASRPINSQELKACAAKGIRFIELPIAFDAITVTVNPANNWATRISTQELSRLWNRQAQGRINRWDQVNASWPAQSIKLCGPGKDSGTFDYFNKAINGSAENSRTDVTTSEDDAVLVDCVSRQKLALGYFGFGWYNANRKQLRPLAVVGPKGPVMPSLESVQKERYLPLSRPLFLYIQHNALQRRPELRRFVTFALKQAPVLVGRARSIPLSETTYRLVENKFYNQVLGTSFGGDLPVGLTISQALARSFDANKRPGFR